MHEDVVSSILASPVVSLDFETLEDEDDTQLIPYEAKPEGGAVGWKTPSGEYRARYFTFKDTVSYGKHPVSWKWFNEKILSPVWNEPKKLFIFQNCKFDIQIAIRRREGYPIKTEDVFSALPKSQVHDTMVLGFLVDENINRSLKELSRVYLKKPRMTYEATQKEISGILGEGTGAVKEFLKLGWLLYEVHRQRSRRVETDLFSSVESEVYEHSAFVSKISRGISKNEFRKVVLKALFPGVSARIERENEIYAKHYPEEVQAGNALESKKELKRETDRAWVYYCSLHSDNLTKFDKMILSLPSGLNKDQFTEKCERVIKPKIMARSRRLADDRMAEYAEEDALDTLKVFDILYPKVAAKQNVLRWYNEVELPWMIHMVEMETTGVTMNYKTLSIMERDLKLYFSQEFTRVQKRVEREHNIVDFNPRSHDQIKDLFWNKMKLKPPPWAKITEKGPATDAAVQKYLAEEQGVDLCRDLLKVSSLSKLYGTYYKNLARRSANNPFRKVRTSFGTVATITGRCNSKAPNLQNIPNDDKMPSIDKEAFWENRKQIYNGTGDKHIKEDGLPIGWLDHPKDSSLFLMDSLRRMFVAPKGYKLIVVDYSQIELRLIAHLSQDANLLRAYRRWDCECGAFGESSVCLHQCPECGVAEGERDKLDPKQPVIRGFCLGLDIHSLTGLNVGLFKRYGPKVGRTMSKPVNFGLCYGKHYKTQAKELGVSEEVGLELYNGYFRLYPGVLAFHQFAEDHLRNNGVFKMPLGNRYRHFTAQHEAMKKGRLKKGEIRSTVRDISNNLPQGGAGDILKVGSLEFLRRKRLRPEWGHVTTVLQVHDELILQAKEEVVDDVLVELIPSLEETVKLSVPILANAVICDTWAEGKG